MVHTKTIDKIILVLIIITAELSRKFTVYEYDTIHTLQFDGRFTISAVYGLILLSAVFAMCRHKNLMIRKHSATSLFFCVIFINVLIPGIKIDSMVSYIAAWNFFFYFLLYIICFNIYDHLELQLCIEQGFKISVLFQSFVGFAYQFFGVIIPFISGGVNVNTRNGFYRMVGTFDTPGELSLCMTICVSYFIAMQMNSETRRVNNYAYIFLGIVVTFMTGARTMLIVELVIIAFAFIQRNKRNYLLVFLILWLSLVIAIVFTQSKLFYNMFVEQDFVEMFWARIAHWKIALSILFQSPRNFLLGIGLNNNVLFIDKNYNMFREYVDGNIFLAENFVRNIPIHNSILIMGVELGIVGLLLFAKMLLYGFFNFLKKRHHTINSLDYFLLFVSLIYIVYANQGFGLLKQSGLVWLFLIMSLIESRNKKYMTVNNM